MKSNAAIEEGGSWAEALAAIGLDDTATAPAPDLALFFANPEYPDLESLVAEAYRRTAASVLIGCSGQGIIGPDREIEGEPALSLLNLDLPGTDLRPKHIEMDDLAPLRTPADWHAWFGITPDQVNAWLLLVTGGYLREHKRYVTLAVGCTGGKHRSVAIAEELGRRLTASGLANRVAHRDMGRE